MDLLAHNVGVISFISLVTLIFIAVWVFFNYRRRTDKHIQDIMEKRISLLEARSIPTAAAFQALLAMKLTHAHTPELDALLARAGPPSNLLAHEWSQMNGLLAERYKNTSDPEVSEEEKDAAYIFPFVVRMARAEYDVIHDVQELIVERDQTNRPLEK